jgi:hypothetical protein
VQVSSAQRRAVAVVVRTAQRRAVAVVVVALLALGPGLVAPIAARAASGSGGQSQLSTTSNPFTGGLTAPGQTTTTSSTPTTTVVNTSTDASGGGISAASSIGIAAAAFIVIIGIAVAIFRDARKRVRVRHRNAAPEERIPGSRRPPKARKLGAAGARRRKRGRAPRRR